MGMFEVEVCVCVPDPRQLGVASEMGMFEVEVCVCVPDPR